MSKLEPTRTYSNPTATDVLRRLLDERGVEHGDVESAPYPPYNSTRRMTTFHANKCVWQYIEDEREGGDIELEGRYMSMSVTPAQAIAATLGSCNCPNNCTNGERTETCEADETDRIECVETVGGRHYDIHIMECTECGHVYEHVNGDYEYCPRCGRKRRDVEE